MPPNLSLMVGKSSHCKTPSSLRWILNNILSLTYVRGITPPLLYNCSPPFLMDYSHVRRCAISQPLISSHASAKDTLLQSCYFPKALHPLHMCALCLKCLFLQWSTGRFLLTFKSQIQMFSSAAYLICPPSPLSATTEFSFFHSCALTIFVMLRHCIYHDALY